MEITFIRHLPTEWNFYGYLQGKRDIPISFPLNKAHIEEIRVNKKKLELLEPFDSVFASSLIRAKKTAEVYGYALPKIEPLLDELDFGNFEGKTKEELINAHGEIWKMAPLDLILGEPMIEFQRRIFDFFIKYRELESILIFGHGSWGRALLSLARTGNIQDMNKVTVENNKLIQVKLPNIQLFSSNEEGS